MICITGLSSIIMESMMVIMNLHNRKWMKGREKGYWHNMCVIKPQVSFIPVIKSTRSISTLVLCS